MKPNTSNNDEHKRAKIVRRLGKLDIAYLEGKISREYYERCLKKIKL